MKQWKKCALKWLGGALIAVSTNAMAAPVIGGKLYGTGGDVIVTVLPASAAFNSRLWLWEPGAPKYIAMNTEPGKVVNLGTYAAGVELVFGIVVSAYFTNHYFYMGDASRNPDNLMHAAVEMTGPNQAIVGFEDIMGGGDLDFNDNMFGFVGVSASQQPQQGVPEPHAAALVGLALAGVSVARLRRRRTA